MSDSSTEKKEGRSARFEIVSDQEGYENNLDYIMLDIPPDQVEDLFFKFARVKNLEDNLKKIGKPSPPDTRWVVMLQVRPYHHAIPGPPDFQGNTTEVVWAPTLLREDIPRDLAKGLVLK